MSSTVLVNATKVQNHLRAIQKKGFLFSKGLLLVYYSNA